MTSWTIAEFDGLLMQRARLFAWRRSTLTIETNLTKAQPSEKIGRLQVDSGLGGSSSLKQPRRVAANSARIKGC
jgi:hypothetical protein